MSPIIKWSLKRNHISGPLPLESDNVEGRLSRGIIVTITLVAALLLILNVVLISCYVRRRNAARKQLHGKINVHGVLIFVLFSFFPLKVCLSLRPIITQPRVIVQTSSPLLLFWV